MPGIRERCERVLRQRSNCWCACSILTGSVGEGLHKSVFIGLSGSRMAGKQKQLSRRVKLPPFLGPRFDARLKQNLKAI